MHSADGSGVPEPITFVFAKGVYAVARVDDEPVASTSVSGDAILSVPPVKQEAF